MRPLFWAKHVNVEQATAQSCPGMWQVLARDRWTIGPTHGYIEHSNSCDSVSNQSISGCTTPIRLQDRCCFSCTLALICATHMMCCLRGAQSETGLPTLLVLASMALSPLLMMPQLLQTVTSCCMYVLLFSTACTAVTWACLSAWSVPLLHGRHACQETHCAKQCATHCSCLHHPDRVHKSSADDKFGEREPSTSCDHQVWTS